MCGDAGQTAQGDALLVFQLRAALEKDHFAVQEAGASGVPNVCKQRVASRFNVVGHRLLGQGNVLSARCGAARFRIVQGATGPKHIGFAVHDAVDIGPEAFVIAKWHAHLELLMRLDVGKSVVLAEGGILRCVQQAVKNRLLRFNRFGRPFLRFTFGNSCPNAGAYLFDAGHLKIRVIFPS